MKALKFQVGETTRGKRTRPTKANAQRILRFYRGEAGGIRMALVNPKDAKRETWPTSTLMLCEIGVSEENGRVWWIDSEIEEVRNKLMKESWAGPEVANMLVCRKYGPFLDHKGEYRN